MWHMTSWFSASMRVLCLVEDGGTNTQDVCVHVFRAKGREDAFSRALELGETHETEYLNQYGKLVRWRFERVLTLDMIGEELDGAEVFSELSEVSGGPGFDAAFSPAVNQPGTSGIPTSDA